jgi:hypothetical protein
MKRFIATAIVLALFAVPALAQDKKPESKPDVKPAAAACCTPKCEMKDGKCVKAEAKKCEKDCAQPCCKKAETKKA